MRRVTFATFLRGMSVVGSVTVLSLAGGTTASAATQPDTGSSTTQSVRDSGAGHESTLGTGGYRGTQGVNLCLLSRCSTGSGDSVGSGIGQVQGGNLCLLAQCEVRP